MEILGKKRRKEQSAGRKENLVAVMIVFDISSVLVVVLNKTVFGVCPGYCNYEANVRQYVR